MHSDIPRESQNLIGDPDATKTTLLQIRFRFHLRSEQVGIHLRQNHGWKFTFVTDVLNLKKREKSEQFGFLVKEESMGGVSLPSRPDVKKRRVSYFYEPSIGDYYYGQGHPMKPHHIYIAHNLFEFCQSSVGGSIGAIIKLNRGDADIALNWAGGLHHAKKSEASRFCYINDIVLDILDQTE